MRRLFLALVLASSGCLGAGFPDVIDSREVSTAFGAPRIVRIRDAGNVHLPVEGSWRGDPDGVAAPGELLLIEGDSFGRQPTVTVGGKAASVLGRTVGDGIIARVPAGTPTGSVAVGVLGPKGHATRTFPIRRLAVVIHDGKAYVLDVSKAGARLVGTPLSLPGAQLLRLSSDGAVAYVVASGRDADRLVVVDLAAAGGPRIIGGRPLTHRASALASAADAGVLAVVGDGQLTIFSCIDARAPAPFPAVELPKPAHAPRAIELSPDGKVLAALVSEGNQLIALDVAAPPALRVINAVDLLPDERLPLVRDMAFSPDGETLWVVSGNNAQTLPAVQPTRLTAVRIVARPSAGEEVAGAAATPPPSDGAKAKLLSVWRTQSLPGAAAPLRLAVARGQPLASGASIRMPPEKAAVFIAAVNDALFKLGEITLDAKSALKLWRPPQPGMIVRADINGGGGPMFATAQIMASLDLTPDAQVLLATAARVAPAPSTGKVTIDFGVTVTPIWGEARPLFLSLGALLPSELRPPFQLGEVRIQP